MSEPKSIGGSSRICAVSLLEHELYSCSRRYSEFNSDNTQANECNSFTNTPLFREDPDRLGGNLSRHWFSRTEAVMVRDMLLAFEDDRSSTH